MNLITAFFIALSLALDAFAVSVTSGIVARQVRARHALKVGAFFGFFQSGMPLIGWGAGSLFKDIIGSFDHWVAFVLLTLIGCHMIYESLRPESRQAQVNPLDFHILLLLSVATSIDALAAGIGFAFLEMPIVRTVLVIGIVTFILSVVGYCLGKRLGVFFKTRVRIVGGAMLILIGAKILAEHL
jgi:putative Mn2+ efflux pump MntP